MKVKNIARKLKRNEMKSSLRENNINATSIEATNKEQNKRSQTQRQKEVEKEINLSIKAGLQSLPKTLKSDFSRKTSHSTITEMR